MNYIRDASNTKRIRSTIDEFTELGIYRHIGHILGLAHKSERFQIKDTFISFGRNELVIGIDGIIRIYNPNGELSVSIAHHGIIGNEL